MTVSNYFAYNQGFDILPAGAFKISPSRLSRFLDSTSGWYRECVLGEEPEFTGNTMSHLGTIVHGLAEMYMKTGRYDSSIVDQYLNSIADPNIDKLFIMQNYEIMIDTLVSSFLCNVQGTAEEFVHHEVSPGFHLAGSIDLYTDEEVIDYKTTNSTSIPTSVRREYFFQQLCYVWLLRQRGLDIRRFRLVYITTNQVNRISDVTGKPMKDYPTQVGSIVHEVTGDDLLMIEGIVKLVAESVSLFQNQPHLRHILAQDMRLKVRQSALFSK